jgi:hypothetical protein
MYSPKIRDPLIPILFLLGQHRKQPMTKVVQDLILEALTRTELPDNTVIPFENARLLLSPTTCLQEAA